MNIVAIIPTFNRCKELKNLLLMLDGMRTSKDATLEIVCAVDGSTDGTLKMLKTDYPLIHVVEGNGNWWYTKSMNEGFRYAFENLSPDIILCINDDIEIKEDYLHELLKAFNEVGGNCLMGSISVSVETPHVITFSGTKSEEKIPFRWIPYIPFMTRVDLSHFTGIYPSNELPGRGMLIPAHILKEADLFDEDFPQYHSDFDFCLRVKKLGYDIHVSYDSVVYSYVHQTSDSTTFKKISTSTFIKNLTNPYSRKHVRQNARYIWRHKTKTLFPFFFAKWFALILINHAKINFFTK